MKLLAFIFALLFSLPAFGVDMTITLTTPQANRAYAACGTVLKKVDAQVPPQPRVCTPAETKTWVIGLVRQVIFDVEGTVLNKSALDAVVVPAFDPS